jgi:hypothetical protein
VGEWRDEEKAAVEGRYLGPLRVQTNADAADLTHGFEQVTKLGLCDLGVKVRHQDLRAA